MSLRTFITTLAVAALGSFATAAQAQDNWPTKPVHIVSPFPAGGTSDVMARIVSEALSKELGQQFIIDNRGGAGGRSAPTSSASRRPTAIRCSSRTRGRTSAARC